MHHGALSLYGLSFLFLLKWGMDQFLHLTYKTDTTYKFFKNYYTEAKHGILFSGSEAGCGGRETAAPTCGRGPRNNLGSRPLLPLEPKWLQKTNIDIMRVCLFVFLLVCLFVSLFVCYVLVTHNQPMIYRPAPRCTEGGGSTWLRNERN